MNVTTFRISGGIVRLEPTRVVVVTTPGRNDAVLDQR